MRRKTERILVAAYVCCWSALAIGGAWAQQKVWPQPEPEAEPAAAPDFTLKKLDGADVSLAGLRGDGHVVVLEWFDPRCDWVKTYHESSTTIKDLRAEFAEAGVRWAAVYSSVPPEGQDAAALNKDAKEKWGIQYPILLDPGAIVAEQYGAERAPFVVVISGEGNVIYKGPVDDSAAPGEPGTEHYLRSALEAATRGEAPAVTTAATPGCRLKAPEEDAREGSA
jgi:peroxiredoxin